MTALRFAYKMTSELTQQDILDILSVLNATLLSWGGEQLFRWKFVDNPDGDSLHLIAYDGSQPIGTVSFWRNDLPETRAYQCVDLGVVPSHRRLGVFQVAATECVARLEGAYLYTFPNVSSPSFPGFLKLGWLLKRKMPISVHLSPGVLRHYEKRECVPDRYAQWRFAQHPTKQYYVYRHHDKFFLLSRRRSYVYIIGGMLSQDFGLPEAHPRLLISYDFPNCILRVPGRDSYVMENPCYVAYEGLIPKYRSDTL